MARPLRIEYEGAFYHVTARENERRKIYFTKIDYGDEGYEETNPSISPDGKTLYFTSERRHPMKIYVAHLLATEVDIDVKPGSDPNCFNINGHGVIPVAMLGSADLDVGDINVDTLSFAGLEVRVRGNKAPLCSVEDSNGDEFLDLVCHFEDDPQNWMPNNDMAELTGELLDGTAIEGTDSICIVP